MTRAKTILELRQTLSCCLKAADKLGQHLTAAHICSALDQLASEDQECSHAEIDFKNKIKDSLGEGGGG